LKNFCHRDTETQRHREMRNPKYSKTILARHSAMILDPHRTNPLYKAIHKVVKKGDVVCDIGAGLGLLSFFALSSGASRVYAIDCDTESLNIAMDFAKKHGIADRISFIEGHSSDVYIGEKADVVICETIGSAAFDENILATLADAKKRLIKREGKIIPAAIELWGAPATLQIPQSKDTVIDTALVPKKNLLCKPKRLARIETRNKLAAKIHIDQKFIIMGNGELSGIAVWPKIEWTKGFVTDASPLKAPTHWKQCVLPDRHRAVKRGDKIKCEIIIQPDTSNPKEQTEILWKLVPSFVRRGKGR